MKEGTIQPVIGILEDNPNPFFKPISWTTKIDFIKKLILENNILVSILGEQNGGKTTFGNILAETLSREVKVKIITSSPLFDAKEILKQTRESLNAPEVEQFSDLIALCNSRKKHYLLIIDDAHYLKKSFITEILDVLYAQKKSFLHVCLISNYSLAQPLNKLSDSYPDLIHSIELGPLTEKELEAYLKDRFQNDPFIESKLNPERIRQFYDLTEGNIVGVNTQMLAFFSQSKITIKKSSKKMYGIAAGIGVLALGAAYVFYNLDTKLVTQKPEMVAQISKPALPAEPIQATPVVIEEEIALTSEIPEFTLAAYRQPVQATSLRKVDLINNSEFNSEFEEERADDSLVLMDKVIVIPKVIGSKAAKDRVNQLQPHKKTVEISKSSGNASVSAVYTIQLLASRSKTDLEHFVKKNQLGKKTNIFKTKSHDADWYVLTLGKFSERGKATKEIQKLPQHLAKLKPWIRGLSDLKVTG